MKIIYTSTLEEGSKNYTIFGKKQLKDKITNLHFQKIWKNTYLSYSQPHTKDLLFKLLH